MKLKLRDTISIRRATIRDVPQLCELLVRLFTQEADFKSDAKLQARGLKLIIRQPEVGRIYCATKGKSVIGMVSLLFTISTAEGGRAAWLEDMIIHPEWCGKGVGGQLLQAAIKQAHADNCTRITLLTDSTNRPAIRFYGKAGFIRSGMVPMRLHL